MINLKELKEFYENQLYNEILPFWLNRGIDNEFGGYYTCFDNYGNHLLSADKFTWSQGRMVWVLSRLSALKNFKINEEKRKYILDLAASGVNFLMDNCMLDNGNCTFLMSREGNKKEYMPGKGYDISIYADCFVTLGLAEYARVSGQAGPLEFSLNLYDSIERRLKSKKIKMEPFPVKEGCRSHAVMMIMLDAANCLAESLNTFNHPRTEEFALRSSFYMKDIMNNFVKSESFVIEIIREDNLITDSLLENYINPGHTMESMWFIMHTAQREKNHDIIDRAIRIIKSTFWKGWDREYGGLFQYVHKEGNKPQGSLNGVEESEMARKILDDWDNKLWWSHSETLYSTLLGYVLTGDRELQEMHLMVREYAFVIFPNPDKNIREWIQIRDRAGNPVQKVVALPVKDPYHILRDLILIIELLEKRGKCK